MRYDDSHEAAPHERLRVFLCHSSKDKLQVRDLYRGLLDAGFRPWLDEEELLAGQDWKTEIRKAVRASHVVIVCLSHNSVSKPGFFQSEMNYALEVAEEQPPDKVFILPVRLEDCEIQERLNSKHYENLFKEGGYARLVKALTAYAKDRNLFTPEPPAEPDKPKPAPPPSPDPAHVRPRPLPRPPRPPVDDSGSNRTTRSIILAASGAVLLAIAFFGVWLSNSRGKDVIATPVITSPLLDNENKHPGPGPRTESTPEPATPEPTPVKSPERPPATPTPAESPTGPVDDKNTAPPPSTDGDVPRPPKPSPSLRTLEVQIFLTRDTQKQMAFVKDLKRRLKPYVKLVTFRYDTNFKNYVKGCRLLYAESPQNEAPAANDLLEHLKSLYPKAGFVAALVDGHRSENILSVVIGGSCKR